MFEYSFLLAIFFCVLSLVYTLISFYGLSLNFENKSNRLFFLTTISLSFWSICYSISSVAESKELALQLNRLSALGWGLYYSFILHFIKIIAKQPKLSKKELTGIYSPSVLFITIFLILDIGAKQFTIYETPWGFVSVSPPTIFNTIFNFYPLIFSILAIRELLIWHKKICDGKTKRLIKTTVYSSTIAIVLSLITDILLRTFFVIPLPQSTIAWLMLPTVSFFYVLLSNRAIHKEFKVDVNDIVDDKSKELVIRMFGYTYVFLGYFSFIIHYLDKTHFKSYQIYISILCIIFGFIHTSLSSLIKSKNVQYITITTLYAIIIFSIMFAFHDKLLITMWALFFCYMIIITIFDKIIYGYIMFVFMVATQILMWVMHPKINYIVFDWTDFLNRIILISVFSFLCFFINYLYRKKVRQNVLQFSNQEIMEHFSRIIFEMNIHNVDEKIIELIKTINEGFDLKTTYYIKLPDESQSEISTFFFNEDRLSHVKMPCYGSIYENDYNNTIFEHNIEFLERLMNNEIISVHDINLEYPDGRDENYLKMKQSFKKRNTTGFYAFSTMVDNKLRGICVSEFHLNEKNKMLHIYLETIRNIISETIEKLDNQKDLFYRANFDKETGLINKEFFIKETNKIIRNTSLNHHYLLYIDIENFKSINDSFGHAIGDEVLKKLADILSELVDDENIITRFTGDEFAVLSCKEYSKKEIESFCKLIIQKFKRGININDNNFILNVCIGISTFPQDGKNIESLLKNANLAMHSSKEIGYMKYHFCDDTNKEQTQESLIYTDKLYNALSNNEFKLAYQAQVDSFTEKIIGVEALLRWDSKDFGLVPPYKFVPILEQTGLIISVGEWIIEECIKQQKKMFEAGMKDIRFSINLSAIQFMDIALIETIKALMKKYEADSKYFEFEITESVAINDSNFIVEGFNKIKKLGFSIAIDDFGTGFSSLNRLQELPIDRLKIDKSFVDGIGKNKKREAIVNVVIELAKNLGLHSIAEGVEYKEQIDYLRERNCEEIQGYYYAKPMFAEELEQFVLEFEKSKEKKNDI